MATIIKTIRLDSIRTKIDTLYGMVEDLAVAYEKGAGLKVAHEEMVNAYTQAHADMDTINQQLTNAMAAFQNAIAVLGTLAG